MKLISRIFFAFLLVLGSCSRITEVDAPFSECYPEGMPVMMYVGFGSPDFFDVHIGTKSEASPADETRVRELYIMLFDSNGDKFYSRNFSYSQKCTTIAALEDATNDSWYVETDANGVTTRGVVKLSTVSKPNCTMVALANVSNTISRIGTSAKAVDFLAGIRTLSQLRDARVTLEQDIITRSDLFLMMGQMTGVYTGELVWGELPDTYYGHTYTVTQDEEQNDVYTLNHTAGSQIELRTLDAKIKFRVKYNTDNTNYIDPDKSYSRNWRVYNLPTSCYLFEPTDDDDRQAASSDGFFSSEEFFFDGSEYDGNDTWQVFTFYMLENFQTGSGAEHYSQREKQVKTASQESGYYENGDWMYAPEHGTYVWFDMVLGLTDDGVDAIVGDNEFAQAITSKAAFTVHLGDFTSSVDGQGHDYNDYTVNRNHCYTYNITIENSSRIYIEVENHNPSDPYANELEPGQEGSLLLVTEGIVNCDAHYEYHGLVFNYSTDYLENGISWYVKTPFSAGGEDDCKDYLWVKFAVNDIVDGSYSLSRKPYPERPANDDSWVPYDPAWDPESGDPRPPMMDIKQLVKYLVSETRKEAETPGSSDYRNGQILVTAFVDEYYYEFDPREYQPTTVAELEDIPAPNPELWRQFVNKPPRELHILSKTVYSQDRKSDVIEANNSIIQQSIQTFYNVFSPTLTSLWGIEHLDEMEFRTRSGKDNRQIPWPWWPETDEVGFTRTAPGTSSDAENGRINTANVWGVSAQDRPEWSQFLDYVVNDNTPELRSDAANNHENDYAFLAYSCLTRNRDNNHNGVIDPEELRWYTAALNQLVGMWVGNESLTPSARLYHPMNASNKSDGTQWRSWVISSTAPTITNPDIIRAEEGCTKSNYSFYTWAFPDADGATKRNKVSSIRCVRNIGTYTDGGTLKDVSHAPFDRMVDQYYMTASNPDGTHTISFPHLNPKSIREYTAEDLPYHDEYSVHNCVYQEFVVQAKGGGAYADGSLPTKYPDDESGTLLDELVLNDAITAQGHNYYCPVGYRLPNMTELLLMEALLSGSYWGSYIYPCRTYYSHGVRGGDPVDSEAVDDSKIGWAKRSDRVNIISQGPSNKITGLRCVRDENRTGVITGMISVKDGDKLKHNEDMTVTLNITSLGSAIRHLDISLVYISAAGVEESYPITPEDMDFSGISVREDVVCHIPDYDDLPILGNITVRVSVLNNAVNTPTVFEVPITLLSPVFTSVKLLHCNYSESDENPPFPVLLTASSASSPITRMTLKVTNPNGISSSRQLFNDASSKKHYLSLLSEYNYRTASTQTGSAPPLQTGTYTFQLEVVAAGKTTRSEAVTMEVLQVNYHPNPGSTPPSMDYDPADYDYYSSNDISVLWQPQQINDIDFYAGDFIEANMDVSTCTYLQVNNGNGQRDNNLTIGRDDLISVGINGTDTGLGITMPYVFHIYFPAHDDAMGNGKDWLRPNLSTSSGTSNGYNYKYFSYGEGTGFVLQGNGSDAKPNIAAYQHYRFDQDGVFWNDQFIDLTRFTGEGDPDKAVESFNAIRDSKTLYIGSTQGYHHSRAKYFFVRVVHNGDSGTGAGGDTGFEDDPNHGGNL